MPLKSAGPAPGAARPEPSARARLAAALAAAFAGFLILLFLVQVTGMDVALRLNSGDVVGWASLAQVETRDTENNVRWTTGLRMRTLSGPTRDFTQDQLAPGVLNRFEAMVGAHGQTEYDRRAAREDPRFRLPASVEAVRRRDGFGAGDSREVPCRVRYAGLLRTVVTSCDQVPEADLEPGWNRQKGRN